MLLRSFRPLGTRFPRAVQTSLLRFLSDSVHFNPNKKTSFTELGITSKSLCSALTSLRYSSPTIIQQEAIPKVLEGTDLVIAAETGCGKTLAYLLPLMELLLSGKTTSRQKYPPVIVLCPTRELCSQIFNVFAELCEAMKTTFLLPRVVVGTEQFPAPFHKITDVLITTPTAFEENETNELYTSCYHLILDEADSLLADSTSTSTKRIVEQFLRAYAKKNKPDHSLQYIFVGATIPTYGTRSVDSYLRHFFPSAQWLSTPLFHRHKPNLKQTWIEAPCEPWELAKLGAWRLALDQQNNKKEGQQASEQPSLSLEGVTKPPVVGELFTPVAEKRLSLLYDALGKDSNRRTVIFCGTLLSCQQVAKYLGDKKRASVMLHRKIPPLIRHEILSKFSKGEVSILICTNAATRGLDLAVDHVIQYDFAENVVDHLHRIGRTGRVSRVGQQNTAQDACVTNFYTEINRALVNSIRAHGDEPLQGSFSRKASFKKKLKKRLGVTGHVEEIESASASEELEQVVDPEAQSKSADSSKSRALIREQRVARRLARRAHLARSAD